MQRGREGRKEDGNRSETETEREREKERERKREKRKREKAKNSSHSWLGQYVLLPHGRAAGLVDAVCRQFSFLYKTEDPMGKIPFGASIY